MIFHREISLFIVLGENGDARNQNNLDVKSSPPGTPESKSSSSTGEGGQATGCGQTGSSSGGGGVCGGNKMMAIRVQMLDDSITLFQVQVRKRIIRRIRMYYQYYYQFKHKSSDACYHLLFSRKHWEEYFSNKCASN